MRLLKPLSFLKLNKNKPKTYTEPKIVKVKPIQFQNPTTPKMLQLKMTMKPFNLKMLLLMLQLNIQSTKKENSPLLKLNNHSKLLLNLKLRRKRRLELLKN
jgi:hypothetical protein